MSLFKTGMVGGHLQSKRKPLVRPTAAQPSGERPFPPLQSDNWGKHDNNQDKLRVIRER